jgi:pyruvate,water dikinase
MPADLEWSIDRQGTLWWLQLRPVTSLDEVHLNEFDEKPRYFPPIYTRANIGEMMPGPVTPLTLSTFGKAIEKATQQLYVSSGAQKNYSDGFIYIHSFYNHLFMDVQALYEIPRHVWLSRKENVDYSVIGDVVEGIEVERETGLPVAILNFIKMIRFVNGGPKMSKKLRQLHTEFKIDCPDNIKSCYEQIDENIPVLDKAYLLHYVTSSQSGSLFATILNILAKGKKPGREHHQKVASMFMDIPDVESANVIHSIDELAGLLSMVPDVEEKFVRVPVEQAVVYLKSEAPEDIRKFWNDFIRRHGYRCVREAELREIEWAIDPTPVIEGLKAKTKAVMGGHKQPKRESITGGNKGLLDGIAFFGKLIIKKILPKARASVARREQSKAHAIGIQFQFKKAYRHLAELLVKADYLDDTDQIFFLLHTEIGDLIRSGDTVSYTEKASQRRKLYPELQALSFPDVTKGIPVPVESNGSDGDGKLKGIPVSRGVVKGKVHLVRNLEEAGKVKKGEIMVVQYTDVGWTPYYGIIAGLITEIGSPLSHGAVVAREYGLPTIVSVKGALATLIDGQLIRLDAVHGKVELLEEVLV